jgi:hypothetical protein
MDFIGDRPDEDRSQVVIESFAHGNCMVEILTGDKVGASDGSGSPR